MTKQTVLSKFFAPAKPRDKPCATDSSRTSSGSCISPPAKSGQKRPLKSSKGRAQLRKRSTSGADKKQKYTASPQEKSVGIEEASSNGDTIEIGSPTEAEQSCTQSPELDFTKATFDFHHDEDRQVAFQRQLQELEQASSTYEHADEGPQDQLDSEFPASLEGQTDCEARGESSNGSDTDPFQKFAATGSHANRKNGGMPASSQRPVQRAKVNYTPLEEQVVELKEKYPGVLLLVECGYRYRFFGNDAKIASSVLSIYAHKDHNFLVASIPTHRLFIHIQRLVNAGHKVGVVNQLETAALKKAGKGKNKTFRRGLAAMYTKATWVGEEARLAKGLEQDSSGPNSNKLTLVPGAKGGKAIRPLKAGLPEKNTAESDSNGGVDGGNITQFLVCLYEERVKGEGKCEPIVQGKNEKKAYESDDLVANVDEESEENSRRAAKVRIGLAAVDVAACSLVVDCFDDDLMRSELSSRLRHLEPVELLVPAAPSLSRETESVLAAAQENEFQAGEGAVRVERRPVGDFDHREGLRVLQAFLSRRDERVRGENSCKNVKARAVLEGEAAQEPRKVFVSSDSQAEGGFGEDEDEQRRRENEDERWLGEGGEECRHGRAEDEQQIQEEDGGAHHSRDREEGELLSSLLPSLSAPCVGALVALRTHLSSFGLENVLREARAQSFSCVSRMVLEGQTLADLEVLRSQADGKEYGSLLWLLNRTCTRGGYLRLREWVSKPLLDPQHIDRRLDAVQELASPGVPALAAFAKKLKTMPDLQLGLSRLHYRKSDTKEFVLMFQALQLLVRNAPPRNVIREEVHSSLLRSTLSGISIGDQPFGAVLDMLNIPAALKRDKIGAMTSPKHFPMMDKARKAIKEVTQELDDELEEIRRELRKPHINFRSLRTGLNSQLEFLIEVKNAEVNKIIPEEWTLVSSTKEVSRFQSPRTVELLHKLECRREELQLEAQRSWSSFLERVDSALFSTTHKLLAAVADLDCLLALSQVAKLPGYCRPRFHARRRMEVREGRHPMLDHLSHSLPAHGQIVPNDVSLGGGKAEPRRCLLLTGPNMGGKSSYVRMAALLAIMAQAGSFVPAAEANMCVFDGLYTRMGAGDDLAGSMSTFLVELWQTAAVLRKATANSLVILDELGRGTSTHDGVAIAYATLHHLAFELCPSTMFVTHYQVLGEMEESSAGAMENAHMGFIEEDAEDGEDNTTNNSKNNDNEREENSADTEGTPSKYKITFLYKLTQGLASRSYGLNVARLAGIPQSIIAEAARKSEQFARSCNMKLHLDSDPST